MNLLCQIVKTKTNNFPVFLLRYFCLSQCEKKTLWNLDFCVCIRLKLTFVIGEIPKPYEIPSHEG